jgi:hypothetical protein
MKIEDIIETMDINDMLSYDENQQMYIITPNMQVIEEHMEKQKDKDYLTVQPKKLMWTPFVLSRDRLASTIDSH